MYATAASAFLVQRGSRRKVGGIDSKASPTSANGKNTFSTVENFLSLVEQQRIPTQSALHPNAYSLCRSVSVAVSTPLLCGGKVQSCRFSGAECQKISFPSVPRYKRNVNALSTIHHNSMQLKLDREGNACFQAISGRFIDYRCSTIEKTRLQYRMYYCTMIQTQQLPPISEGPYTKFYLHTDFGLSAGSLP